MYGMHESPLFIRKDNISLSIDRKDSGFQYLREAGEERLEKFLLAQDCSILINPVEPLHTPKDITPYLLVDFEKNLVIEPKGTSKIFLKFPVEVAVFAGKSGNNSKDFRIIDIFSLHPGKYSLYGDVRTGILCKYYKSDVFMAQPCATPFVDGIIELTISNRSDRWSEVSKVVFNAYLMKIYYSQDKMGMKALMSLIDKDIAETSFSDSPLEKGMKKAVEHYVSRGMIMTSSSFKMEWGYDSQ